MKLLSVLEMALARINGAMNTIADLIVSYGSLEQDKAYILEQATMKQAIYALLEMVKQEYPFGWIGQVFNQDGPILSFAAY